MKGQHPVVEQISLVLGKSFYHAGSQGWDGKLLQMLTDESPCTFQTAAFSLELILKIGSWFVYRDDQILFDSTATCDLFKGTLLFIERTDICNHKTSLQ